jgi:hypothetical protein
MAAADAWATDHGACGSADDCTDRSGHYRAGGAADYGAGRRSFLTARRVRGDGEGGERRKCGGDEKFSHGLLHKFNLKKNAQMLAKFAASTFCSG